VRDDNQVGGLRRVSKGLIGQHLLALDVLSAPDEFPQVGQANPFHLLQARREVPAPPLEQHEQVGQKGKNQPTAQTQHEIPVIE